ncbi:MAG: prepilin-type N-terminal cleavage/methylation domain-containing protein [Candidatus Electrothrix sp. AS4_5]|nr:prepilin-type N-terminal cleavage/methylation domain-containing protein [Candidatus Electrothrix gigas]
MLEYCRDVGKRPVSEKERKNMKRTHLKDKGFTLVEIMVSMVISSLVMAGIYGVYTIQQRSYTVQEQVSEMQQRIRSALDFMTRNIRMAGYDPTGVCKSDFIIADSDTLVFDVCERRTGVPEYRITLDYDASEGKLNVTRDAGRTGTGTSMPLAEGVDAFLFSYRDDQGNVTTVVDDMKVVEVSMLVRSTYPDPRHTDTITYVPASETLSDWIMVEDESGNPVSNPPLNDNFHRRLLTTSIALRNM